MKIGYARVSTLDQNLQLQEDALIQAGCEKIITDTISGKSVDRPGLARLREILRSGDILVVWRLDRLGRSLKDLVQWVGDLEEQGIGFQSLQEAIDTTSPSGKLVFHLFASLAEFDPRTDDGRLGRSASTRKNGWPTQETRREATSIVCHALSATTTFDQGDLFDARYQQTNPVHLPQTGCLGLHLGREAIGLTIE